MNSSFVSIPAGEWRLSSTIEISRRNALQEDISFEQIINLIAKNATLASIKKEKYDSQPKWHRVVIVLKTDALAVDLFHNSRCGYRAQYYFSIENGELANEYAVRILASKIKELSTCAKTLQEACMWKSLSDAQAKVWIHQGLWFRYRQISDRNICIQRWASSLQSENFFDRKRALWGSLSATGENKLDIKGGFVDSNGSPLGVSHKPSRGQSIHDFGFT